MKNQIPLATLASGIRAIFRENETGQESAVEKFLQDELQSYPEQQQLTFIRMLRDSFSAETATQKDAQPADWERLSKLLSLFLGKRSEEIDHFSEERAAIFY